MRSAQNCARTCPGLNLKPYQFPLQLPDRLQPRVEYVAGQVLTEQGHHPVVGGEAKGAAFLQFAGSG